MITIALNWVINMWEEHYRDQENLGLWMLIEDEMTSITSNQLARLHHIGKMYGHIQ